MPANPTYDHRFQGSTKNCSNTCEKLFLPFSDLVNSIGCNVFRSVLVVLGIALDSQNSNQTQTTQPQSVDTCNSDKAAETEKSKESSAAS